MTQIRRGIVAVALVAAALAGCGSDNDPRPRAIDGVFPPTAELAPLPFRVTDDTGLIRGLAVVRPDGIQEGVSQVPGRGDSLYLTWLGGACDRRVMVVFEHRVDRHGFTITTERDFGGCRLVGFQRSLLIEFTQPIDASTVSISTIE